MARSAGCLRKLISHYGVVLVRVVTIGGGVENYDRVGHTPARYRLAGSDRAVGGTLKLVHLPVMPPVAPMLAKPAAGIPAGQHYEPKWDGFRSIVFRDGDEVEIGSRNERPMTRYFPDVVAAVLANFPPRAVIDGEIVIADTERNTLDFEALQQRIHPAASRVKLLSEQTPASFIASNSRNFSMTCSTGKLDKPFSQLTSMILSLGGRQMA